MFVWRRLSNVSLILNASCRIRYETRGLSKVVQSRQPQKQLQQLVRTDLQYAQKQKSKICQLFPKPKMTLNNMFNNLHNHLDRSYKCQHITTVMGRVANQSVFQSTCTVNWPKPVTFNGYGYKKKDAEMNAMFKTLEFLYSENQITSDGHPITVTKDEKQKLLEEWCRPPVITVLPHLMEEGLTLLDEFKEVVQPYLEQRNEKVSFLASNYQVDSEDEQLPNRISAEDAVEDSELEEEMKPERDIALDLLTGREYVVDPEVNVMRSKAMYRKLSERSALLEENSRSKTLPMSEYKEVLEKALDNYQVVIVAGDTGCGKSTQVPQMILDKWTKEGRGADCNILVSQPRRISAISLAKYVAFARKEKLGESVGHHVRLNYKRLWNRGGMMFLTTGMLLQSLHSNPSLEGVSHVIIDEVHERSVPTDLLLILLRRLTLSNKDLKLILMSASLSTVELQKYFGKDESALIEVPGALYPLTRHYLENAFKELELSPKRYQLRPLMEPGPYPFVNTDLVLDVVKAIDSTRPPGAILCFLPGWQDISTVQMRLQENQILKERLWVLPLHSRLSASDQEKIFEAAPGGMRKVVLTTNIAETSLTVEDVVYVIDTGCHKEQRYDSRKDVSVLGNHWISKANGQQRAGRAGRVQPGEVFHLYSDSIHKDMSSFPVPEIMRIPLEHVVLQCKAHCGEENALTFLSDALSIPSNMLIAAAVRNLEDLGMLRSNYKESVESLTPLGRRVVHFSTPPHLSKALVYSSIFRCVDSALSISAALSGGRGIFHNSIETRSGVRKTKVEKNPTSDLLAMLGLIQEWEEMSHYRDSNEYCNNNHLSHRGLVYNNGVKKVYGNHLTDGFMIDDEGVHSRDSKWNVNNLNSQLLLGILLAGVNRILIMQKGILFKGILKKDSVTIKTLRGLPINTASDCVLHTIPKDMDEDSRYLLCVHLLRDDASRRTVARDLSLLQPLTVALFAGHSIVLKRSLDGYLLTIDGQEKISFQVDQRTGNFISELRNAVDKMVEIIIETRGLDAPLPPNFESLCDRLVQYVSNLLEKKELEDERVRRRSILYDDDDW